MQNRWGPYCKEFQSNPQKKNPARTSPTRPRPSARRSSWMYRAARRARRAGARLTRAPPRWQTPAAPAPGCCEPAAPTHYCRRASPQRVGRASPQRTTPPHKTTTGKRASCWFASKRICLRGPHCRSKVAILISSIQKSKVAILILQSKVPAKLRASSADERAPAYQKD